MEGFCLRTHLIEKPSVFLYYKGMEDNNTVPDALNVVVAFMPAEAEVLDEDAAKSLCQRLNDNSEILQANGFGEFEIEYCAINELLLDEE
jgi:hypothetical protein